MAHFERIRDVVSGPFDSEVIRQRTASGWQMVSIEWRRELPESESPTQGAFNEDIPYGLRISDDCQRLVLGHRNWILIVDSAYPPQTSPGVETIETNAAQLEVVRTVLSEIESSIQVRPVVYMDAELSFISDSDAPGVSAYRSEIGELVHKSPAQSRRHETLISDIAEAGKTFHVLVLKTNMTIPYTSLFIRLDCKYWSTDQEKNLRLKMSEVPPK